MAPEQAQNPAAVDKRADIYAIGILLFEALCGQRPFNGHTLGELIGAHLFQTAEKPSVLYARKGLPPRTLDWRQLDAIVGKALAKLPSARFQDCASLARELETAWGDHGQWAAASEGYSSQSGFAPAPRAARSGARLGLIGGAVFALSAVGGGLWASTIYRQRAAAAAVANTPLGRATSRLQAAQRGGMAERRELVAAVELVRSRVLLPYVEVALRDPAAAVWPAAVPVAAAIGTPGDALLRELLAQRAAQPAGAVAVELAAARLRLGATDAAPALTAVANSDAVVPRLRATLALALAGLLSAAELQKVLARSVGASSIPPALRQAALVQLVKMADQATEKQLQQALHALAESPPSAAATSAEAQAAADEALIVYARAGRPTAAARLAQAAQKAPLPRRLELAVALADAGDSRALEFLLPLLREGTPRVRQRAAGAVGSLGVSGAPGTLPLVSLLDDPDPGVALTAAAAVLAISAAAASQPAASAERPDTRSDGLHASR